MAINIIHPNIQKILPTTSIQHGKQLLDERDLATGKKNRGNDSSEAIPPFAELFHQSLTELATEAEVKAKLK